MMRQENSLIYKMLARDMVISSFDPDQLLLCFFTVQAKFGKILNRLVNL